MVAHANLIVFRNVFWSAKIDVGINFASFACLRERLFLLLSSISILGINARFEKVVQNAKDDVPEFYVTVGRYQNHLIANQFIAMLPDASQTSVQGALNITPETPTMQGMTTQNMLGQNNASKLEAFVRQIPGEERYLTGMKKKKKILRKAIKRRDKLPKLF